MHRRLENREWHAQLSWQQVCGCCRLPLGPQRSRRRQPEGVQVQVGAMAIANRFVVFTWPQQTEPCKSIGTLGDTWRLHLGRVFCGSALCRWLHWSGWWSTPRFLALLAAHPTYLAAWTRLLVGKACAGPGRILWVRSGTALEGDAGRPGRSGWWPLQPPQLLPPVPQ